MAEQPSKEAISAVTPPSLHSGDLKDVPTADAFAIPDELVTNRWQSLANNLIGSLGAEARGIERVDETLRLSPTSLRDYVDLTSIWFSVNLTANILTIGVLGPVAFGLGGIDSMMCCLFGTALGSIATCYMATFGPMSGNRSLVSARYTMGWWPTKICVMLALVVILGYGMVNAVTTGLIFSAVSDGKVSSIVGIIIFGLIVWTVAGFGIKHVKLYERYAFIPQVCALFVLIGAAAPYMNVQVKSELSGRVLIGARVSYFFTCASGPLGWAPFIADSLTYYNPSTNRVGVIAATFTGFMASKIFVQFVGIALGTGLATQADWMTAFGRFGVGGLIVAAYSPVGAFGKVCAVIIGLGIAANMVPGNYSAAFCAQLLATKSQRVPRIVWNTICTIIFIVIAIPGRDKLLTIFSNFLPLIGYWVFLWILLTLQEEFLFRRHLRHLYTSTIPGPYDWTAWNDKSRLPHGFAALASFLLGWVGAILCMSQVYYVGPIAKLAGPADIGLPVAAAWGGAVYPVLRWLELKRFGR
ncbi:Purine-cytosine permease fcyB [Sphaceloma murrayae]|uniref:Purine-cytosine permease fcyB n=1 Tax=Sphaceloma murrayae TaxID=2082308 RepID=A0A2K1QIP2_9PEZI|nr:Purine-cytosine permease fcyB [Sphaceloma murrayae]